jgi:hypothetical protein
LHLIERAAAFTTGEAAHGILHLIEGSSSFTVSSDNREALGHAAHGVLHLVEGSSSTFLFLSLLGFLCLLGFPSL